MEAITVGHRMDRNRHYLRFRVGSADALARLRRAFQSLADGSVEKIDLGSFDWIRPQQNLGSIQLKLLSLGQEPARTLRVYEISPNNFKLEWSRHSEGWLENAELLDGLKGPGHQYLNCGASDAEIEVSYLENATSD